MIITRSLSIPPTGSGPPSLSSNLHAHTLCAEVEMEMSRSAVALTTPASPVAFILHGHIYGTGIIINRGLYCMLAPGSCSGWGHVSLTKDSTAVSTISLSLTPLAVNHSWFIHLLHNGKRGLSRVRFIVLSLHVWHLLLILLAAIKLGCSFSEGVESGAALLPLSPSLSLSSSPAGQNWSLWNGVLLAHPVALQTQSRRAAGILYLQLEIRFIWQGLGSTVGMASEWSVLAH